MHDDPLRALRPSIVVTIDELGTILSANDALLTLLGRAPADVVGQKISVLMPPAEAGEHDNYLDAYRSTGIPHVIGTGRSVQAQHADGTLLPMFLSVGEVDLGGRKVFVGSLFDLRAEQEAIRRRIQAEERFSRLAALPGTAVLRFDCDARCLVAQPGWQLLTGQSPDHARQYGYCEMVHPEDREGFADAVGGRHDGPSWTVRLHRPNGGGFNRAHVWSGPADGADSVAGQRIVVLQDIEAFARAEELFRLGFNASHVAKYVRSAEGIVEMVNPAACELLGRAAHEIVGNHAREFKFVRSDPDEGAWRLLDEAIGALGTGQASNHRQVVKLVRPDGAQVWGDLNLVALPSAGGGAPRYIGEIIDISVSMERFERLERTAQQLQAANEELSGFVRLLAHDLQRPLRSVRSFVQAARLAAGPLPSEAEAHLDRAEAAGLRANDLLDVAVRYSRLGADADLTRSVDVGRVAADALDLHGGALSTIGATVELGPLPSLPGDVALLRELFTELLANCIEFRRPGTPLLIELRAERVGSDWHLSISDNGIGVAPEHRERIFELFRRLRPREDGSGRGSGLAIARRIAQCHRGTVTASSNATGGTTMHITLPASLTEGPSR